MSLIKEVHQIEDTFNYAIRVASESDNFEILEEGYKDYLDSFFELINKMIQSIIDTFKESIRIMEEFFKETDSALIKNKDILLKKKDIFDRKVRERTFEYHIDEYPVENKISDYGILANLDLKDDVILNGEYTDYKKYVRENINKLLGTKRIPTNVRIYCYDKLRGGGSQITHNLTKESMKEMIGYLENHKNRIATMREQQKSFETKLKNTKSDWKTFEEYLLDSAYFSNRCTSLDIPVEQAKANVYNATKDLYKANMEIFSVIKELYSEKQKAINEYNKWIKNLLSALMVDDRSVLY